MRRAGKAASRKANKKANKSRKRQPGRACRGGAGGRGGPRGAQATAAAARLAGRRRPVRSCVTCPSSTCPSSAGAAGCRRGRRSALRPVATADPAGSRATYLDGSRRGGRPGAAAGVSASGASPDAGVPLAAGHLADLCGTRCTEVTHAHERPSTASGMPAHSRRACGCRTPRGPAAPPQNWSIRHTVATKIKLMRLGKMRAPYYRIVVADARTKRDGRVIETIGKYHPKEDPSLHRGRRRPGGLLARCRRPADRARAGDPKVTGDWQKFKGEPAPPADEGRRAQPTRRPVRGKRPAGVGRETSRTSRAKKAAKAEAAKAASRPKAEPKADGRRPEKPDKAESPKADAPRPRPGREPARSRRGRDRRPTRPRGSLGARGGRRAPGPGHRRASRRCPASTCGTGPARQAARGAGAPRRPGQGDRPQRAHRAGAAHRHGRVGGRGIRVDVVDTDEVR